MRRPVEAGLLVLLTASLAIKIAVGLPTQGTGSQERFETSLAAALADYGYAVDATLPDTEPAMLPVQRNNCQMLIAVVSPLGWHRDLLEQLAGGEKQLAYAFAGAITAEQPVWRTAFARGRARLSNYLQMAWPDTPVLAVISGADCDPSFSNEIAQLAVETTRR